jgi:hypothetical protein
MTLSVPNICFNNYTNLKGVSNIMPFLNHDHKPLIRHPQGHPVTVIAAFNTVGDLIPRYFSIEDDNCEVFKYQISAIKSIRDKFMIKEFYCCYDSNGYRNDLMLCFDITACRWVIG